MMGTNLNTTQLVDLGSRGLRINDKFLPIAAGAFEYWRHNPLYWRKILQAMKASGIEQVGTFVCWEFHEIERGDFDFTGRTYPSRDLAGFIDLCASEQIGVLIRIGPYIDAEWPSRGVAEDVERLERLDPFYQLRTREYVNALAPILIPRLASVGGPVQAIQIDCEPFFPRSTTAATDTAAGTVQVPYDEKLVMGLYREWLATRYPGKDQLATKWRRVGLRPDNATEPDFSQASLPETLDAFEFMSDAVLMSFRGLRKTCDDAGLVGVPYYTNSKNLMHFLDWRQIEAETLDCHSFGLAFPNMWPGDQKLSVSWFLRLFRARTRFCWAGEFQAGTADGRVDVYGVLTPEHNRFSTLLAMALGMRGLCYYMYVDRDNSLFSPISPLGQVRPRMAAFRDATKVLKALRPDTHIAKLGLLWSLQHHRCFIATRFSDWTSVSKIGMEYADPKELGPWWEVFRTLHDVDADFDIAPLDQGLVAYHSAIYAGPAFAERLDMERLRDWVVGGGKLLVTTALPTHSFDGESFENVTLELERHPNVTLRSWGGWKNHLEELEAWAGLRALASSVWTAAYRDEEGLVVFISNVGESPKSADVRLSATLAVHVAGHAARDVLTEERWQVSGENLWRDTAPLLMPNEIRCIRIEDRQWND